MTAPQEDGAGRKRIKLNPPDTRPYILRSLLDTLPLAPEGDEQEVHINCVELWAGNLYIGTSAAEILHFVSLPPDPSEDSDIGTFILASRLQPNPDQGELAADSPGVQRIVLLPAVAKACILCNGIATFYSLPELSPAFGNNLNVQHCTWIGGIDLNRPGDEVDDHRGQVVMIATSTRIMLVRIGDEPRRIKRIDFPTCLISSRRGTISCVADAHSYALLDLEHQQKNPLFPISSLDETEAPQTGQIQDIPYRGGHTPSGSVTLLPSDITPDSRGHGRNTSLGTFIEGLGRRQSPHSEGGNLSGMRTPDLIGGGKSPMQATSPERRPSRSPAPADISSAQPPNMQAVETAQKALPELPVHAITKLRPHIASPNPNEFLLTTGTEPSEPGVGMFVNLDGDVVRGTIEFSRYPQRVILDGLGQGEHDFSQNEDADEEGFVLAVIPGSEDAEQKVGLEVQRWDVEPGDPGHGKVWIDIPSSEKPSSSAIGASSTLSSTELSLPEIGDALRQVRLDLSTHRPPERIDSLADSSDPRTRASLERMQREKELFETQDSTDSEGGNFSGTQLESEEKRNAEEAQRLGKWTSRILLWSGSQIWWVVKNPLVLQLDAALQIAQTSNSKSPAKVQLDRVKVATVFNDIRGRVPRTEMEFLGMNYIRQKAGLLLFVDLLTNPKESPTEHEEAMLITENALIDGGLDPRVVLLMVPLVRREVAQGPRGVWVPAGLSQVVRDYVLGEDGLGQARGSRTLDGHTLMMIKRYLSSWRDDKGFGSIPDGQSVSRTVDASLLHLLLHLDEKSPKRAAEPHSLRAELNRAVDNKFGNFERAVELLESYHRLYVLSRLYQSRKLAKDVLGTWKRIIEGEEDAGGELSVSDCEVQIRRYLVIIRDRKLIEQYGTWLAERNPKLAIQVFADEKSRVKFEPPQVIAKLREGAPGAVQEYLEHLVFSKNQTQYADDLIGYYLDTVINVLENSPAARSSLTQTYSTYRALRPPKPTYLTFITDNAPPDQWWQSRLRLLQLLGSSRHSSVQTQLSYDIPTVLARIEPFEKELVSESIILDGRQGRHTQALRLLTHGLGDYDTAIRYCLLGGESVFHQGASPAPQLLPESIPSVPEQSKLFNHLLGEFLAIENVEDRLERTSELLARFAGWFDVREVLERVPASWSVDVLAEFLVRVLRKMTGEKHEAEIVKSLAGAENLRVQVEFIIGCEKVGGRLETAVE